MRNSAKFVPNSFASNPSASRGRMFDVGDSPTRSEFQRDRDRIIHSTAFRRLQHKTQVFLHHEGNHFRTRLTHTLEVSQIARSIARALGVNEDLAEAIALAHDLGHPPFGHAGERILDEKMQKYGGFDHNLQALRTVVMLENRYATHNGLNLTWESLEGILKHNGPFSDIKNKQMPDVFDLEPSGFASIEAQIAAIADDIAYNSHDIDDGMRSKLICANDFKNVALVGDIANEILALYPKLSHQRMAHEVQRRLITQQIEDVILTSKNNIAALNPQNVNDVHKHNETLICFSPNMAKKEKLLKEFLYKNVYRSNEVMKNVKIAQSIIAKLFDYLFKTNELPQDWQEKLKQTKDEKQKARVICDYIAGMSDPYAIDLYNQKFDARVHFV